MFAAGFSARLRPGPLLLVLPIVAACGADLPDRPEPLVLTAVAQAADADRLSLSGTVEARSDAALAFRVGGLIEARLVDRGARVRRGQPLMRLDTADASLAAAEARATADAAVQAVVAARANSVRAVADAERLEPLVGAGGISAQAMDQARAAASAAAAELQAAERRASAAHDAASRAGNAQRYATLVADSDGVVGDVLADAGQVVAEGQPVLRLARAGGRDAVVTVPEGMRRALPRTAEARLVGDGRRFSAQLREVSGVADPGTRSFEARYALLGTDPMPPGQSVRLDMRGAASSRALAVPAAALIDRGKGPAVWVVQANGRVKLRPVQVSGMADEQAIVVRGLTSGERVVALGAHLLADGQAVRIGKLPR